MKTWYARNQIAVTPWLFLLPALFMFALYVVWPIAQSFNLSLYKWDGLNSPDGEFLGEYVGFANYEKLLTDDRAFNTSLWNNAKWLVFYLLAIPAGLFIALFLNQTVRGIRLYKSLFFFPFVISQIVVGLVFTWFYDPTFGLFNGIIGVVGLGPVNVLGDPTMATYGIIAAGLHTTAFGLDPLTDKRMEGIDTFQQDRVAKVVDEAEAHLASMKDHIADIGDRHLDNRVEQFQAMARKMIRTVEEDPRDLTGARKFLGVYLMGARDASVKFADLYKRQRNEAARSDFDSLLADLEQNFDARTEKMLLDDRSDMDIEIKVLRDRLQREGL